MAKLLLDADAFPRLARAPLLRVAQRHELPTVIVAATRLSVMLSPSVSTVAAGLAPNAADQHILAVVAAGDAVVTSDTILATTPLTRVQILVADWHGFPYRLVDGARVKRTPCRRSARSRVSERDPHRSRYSGEDVLRLLRTLCQHFKLSEQAPQGHRPFIRVPAFVTAALR